MNCVVFAYHNIGCEGVKALLANGYTISAIFTHKDNPAENIWFDSVAELACSKGIPVFAPESVNHPVWVERIKAMKPDMIFSFYFREMLGAEIIESAPMGAVNLHGSLLPKYRGRVPLNWALINGEKEAGVTMHYMTVKPDAGDIVGQEKFEIAESDDIRDVFGKAVKAAAVLLGKMLPLLKSGKAPRIQQDKAQATYFGGRKPADGEIDWKKPASAVRNLVRAVTRPYPGAFTFMGDRKAFIWSCGVVDSAVSAAPGTIVSADPLVIACGEGAVKVTAAQWESGVFASGAQFASDGRIVKNMVFTGNLRTEREKKRRKSVLILGVNGFIGSHISDRLLASGKYEVYGMDLRSNYVTHLLSNPDFHFFEGDVSINAEWIEYHVRKCDIVLPLVAVATPIEYTRNPLRVFQLDFEENLKIVRYCVKHNKRILFPSTSEVYGMCTDDKFDEENSNLITGPIRMQRWIYSCSKQMMDRVIWAYGAKAGLKFTLFRPFNWIGPRLDSLMSARIGSSRAITQMILNLVQGSPIQLIDGGEQKRCFVDVSEAVEALYRVIENENGCCDGKIINIGNPDNEASVKRMAEILVEKFEQHPLRGKFPPFAGYLVVESGAFYGKGYQDVQHRKPSIENARKILKWEPKMTLEESTVTTLDFFLKQAIESGEFGTENE
ncbi:MAG: bifunctional UDP-4-amino-4-deoxy-L-arabinose formyltransferase/UDP-glucuronic acid oxidase ArnA [Victivallaceae bacterium]|nr:bifunctional UDP-4-amino-4-deoxy-L-arabinose formyltransferase/UDP-glucuronic acid oxidase ArnA [Victivallaceae bacterium]